MNHPLIEKAHYPIWINNLYEDEIVSFEQPYFKKIFDKNTIVLNRVYKSDRPKVDNWNSAVASLMPGHTEATFTIEEKKVDCEDYTRHDQIGTFRVRAYLKLGHDNSFTWFIANKSKKISIRKGYQLITNSRTVYLCSKEFPEISMALLDTDLYGRSEKHLYDKFKEKLGDWIALAQEREKGAVDEKVLELKRAIVSLKKGEKKAKEFNLVDYNFLLKNNDYEGHQISSQILHKFYSLLPPSLDSRYPALYEHETVGTVDSKKLIELNLLLSIYKDLKYANFEEIKSMTTTVKSLERQQGEA